MQRDIRFYIDSLDAESTAILEQAVALCAARHEAQVDLTHLGQALCASVDDPLREALLSGGIDVQQLCAQLRHGEAAASGQAPRRKLGADVMAALRAGWTEASLRDKTLQMRVTHLWCGWAERAGALAGLPWGRCLPQDLAPLVSALRQYRAKQSRVGKEAPGASQVPGDLGPALRQFTYSLRERAASGALDPICGRVDEVRQVVDILCRRRKNNPILLGEPGVGKTALVEGLAHALVQQEVPEKLQNCDLRVLDLAGLRAGASAQGDMQKRISQLVSDMEQAEQPVILFIDEAHMMVRAADESSTDIANLLKPALARGTLRLIAATTQAEYKRYIAKDAALARRFHSVPVEEPDNDTAIAMVRTIAPRYRRDHGVDIDDEALIAAVTLSRRYIAGRQLPDKAIDIIDTAAAHALTTVSVPPAALLKQEDRLRALSSQADSPEKAALQQEVQAMREAWDSGQHDRQQTVPRVGEAEVAQAIARLTGVPIGQLKLSLMHAAAELESRLAAQVFGQDEALAAVADAVRGAMAGLRPSHQPLGVLLLAGPSGVGKTQTTNELAACLFGDVSARLVINMTEFQEKHSVARLVGAPPGYVGYGEGGMLTEALRQRPYRLVVLEECEKAHPEVLDVFHQVFDQGTLQDGEGNVVDCRHALFVLTTNAGSDDIHALFAQRGEVPMHEAVSAVLPALGRSFSPSMLGRMTSIVFRPLSADILLRIVASRLDDLIGRARSAHGIEVRFDAAVAALIVQDAVDSPLGARRVAQKIERQLVPPLARALLQYAVLPRAEVPASLLVRAGNVAGVFEVSPC